MNNNITPQSDYMLQNAVLSQMSRPPEGISQPQVADSMTRWANAKANAASDDIRFSQNLAQQHKHFLSTILNARKQLDTWKKNNTIATLLTGATIPVQGYASYQQVKKADDATAKIQDQINSNKSLIEAIQNANLAAAARHKQALKM